MSGVEYGVSKCVRGVGYGVVNNNDIVSCLELFVFVYPAHIYCIRILNLKPSDAL